MSPPRQPVVSSEGLRIHRDPSAGRKQSVSHRVARAVLPQGLVVCSLQRARGMDGQASPKPGPERLRVMIVDDDAEMRAVLRDALEREGFRVREHSAGDQLVPLVAEWKPDAVVLDKEMVGSSGLDLLRDIRRRHPGTPVVLVTAFGGAAVEAEALRLGAAYYMDKPFRVSRLLEVLRSVAGQTGSKSELTTGRAKGDPA